MNSRPIAPSLNGPPRCTDRWPLSSLGKRLSPSESKRTSSAANPVIDPRLFASARSTPIKGKSIAQGDRKLSQAAISARGRSLPPVWTLAYTALAGLYFQHWAPEVTDAFAAALGPSTIGERIGKPVDRARQLAGDLWFYYGSRYGEYLKATGQPDRDAYLASEIEGTPAQAGAYFRLAECYREYGDFDRAVIDYEHALELDPSSVEALLRIAVIRWDQGRRAEAESRFQTALTVLAELQDQRHVPESFWGTARSTLELIGERKLLPELRPAIDRLVQTYVRRNGSYRVEPMLRGILAAAGAPDGVRWILDLARAANDQTAFLDGLTDAAWIAMPERGLCYTRIIEVAAQKVAESHGEARELARGELYRLQLKCARYYLDQNEPRLARLMLESVPDQVRASRRGETAPIEVGISVREGRLTEFLEGYRREHEKASADTTFLLMRARDGSLITSRWDDPERPLPLGSLLKPFAALAYGETHAFDYPQLLCRGTADQCWLPHGHGRVTLDRALAHSCNAYFHVLTTQLNGDTMSAVARRFGLGNRDAGVSAGAFIGMGKGWKVAPIRILAAYCELAKRRGEPGVSEIVRGLSISSRQGTGRAIGDALPGLDLLAKTGTAPCTHLPNEPGDGDVVVLYPSDGSGVAVLLRAHGVPGAQAASLLAEM
ncbi:MAG: tetratricopeptide repeat protein [Acidobacteria bacterium]|nr:tetratricopeptide repeat protein [Acidobacteriota bacterium]